MLINCFDGLFEISILFVNKLKSLSSSKIKDGITSNLVKLKMTHFVKINRCCQLPRDSVSPYETFSLIQNLHVGHLKTQSCNNDNFQSEYESGNTRKRVKIQRHMACCFWSFAEYHHIPQRLRGKRFHSVSNLQEPSLTTSFELLHHISGP